MKNASIVSVLLLAICVFLSCGCARVETYGEHIANKNFTPISAIVAHPEQYIGKTVTVKGRIDIECNTGCWFNLKDGAAVIYTTIEAYGLAIPQRVGKTAIVEGAVSVEEGKLTLTGKGVEIR
jgi:hypothetical protein